MMLTSSGANSVEFETKYCEKSSAVENVSYNLYQVYVLVIERLWVNEDTCCLSVIMHHHEKSFKNSTPLVHL